MSTPQPLSGMLAHPLLAPWLQWLSETRLYQLEAVGAGAADEAFQDALSDLMVERFVLHEALSEPFVLELQVLSLRADLPLKALHGRPVRLGITLADGQRSHRSGYITSASALDADGGLAHYRLRVQPWPALLNATLASRVWQERSIIEIIDDVFTDHQGVAAWRWDVDVPAHVRSGLYARFGGQRPYCVQYRETDLAFVQRLLAEEGMGWRVEETPADDHQAPGGHTVVLFASSAAQPEDPSSASDLGGRGIRYHRSSSQEVQDSIQALGAVRQLGPTSTVVVGWDSQAQQVIHAEVPTHHQWGGPEARSLQHWLSSYDPHHSLAALGANPQACATWLQEAREARYKSWLGRGSVRTLRAGTWAEVTQSTLDGTLGLDLSMDLDRDAPTGGSDPEARRFLFTHVQAVGINNLPKDLQAAVARLDGRVDGRLDGQIPADPLDDGWPLLPALPAAADTGTDVLAHGSTRRHPSADLQPLITQARATGYACAFQALRRNVPWRPVLLDDTGLRPRPRPTALGFQTAIVVGPDGQPFAQGADELHTDGQGRVKVRFHWQANPYAPPQRAQSDHSCWLRVVQAHSGAGMGQQFIPRIGQEVLVGFINHDMDLPYVQASLYNGQGDGGIPRTPGGQAAAHDTSPFNSSTDHRPSAQGNRIASGTGGHSPAWHGGAPGAAQPGQDGQANAAALSGVKSKEFGGHGANQLVLDDTPSQGRVHLHSSQHQTWLSMGHLLHQADNHRGSFRGLGLELRTDAWGGLRAVRGVMLSTYGLRNGLGNGLGQTPEGAGDNAAGIALAKQMQQLATTFGQAATTHQTVAVAAAQGSHAAGQSTLDDTLAPAAALTKSLSGMVSATSLPNAQADAADKNTATAKDKVPHTADPDIAIVGKAGIGLTAGQDIHLSSGDTTTLATGEDTHWAIGGQARIHTGQAIGVLAGAMQAGNEAAGKGLTMVAASGPIDLQAQAGPAQIAAKQRLELKTASGVVNLAAAKRVVLAVSGGASIVIEGGQMTVQCPGTLTIKAGKKSMVGPGTQSWAMPQMPGSICVSCLLAARASASAFAKE
jgi:uncharacterized protein involved in type VI secretion and phage assembly